MAEKSVQFLFGNNHPEFVAAVDDEYDGVALSEEDRGGAEDGEGRGGPEAEIAPLLWRSMSHLSVLYL